MSSNGANYPGRIRVLVAECTQMGSELLAGALKDNRHLEIAGSIDARSIMERAVECNAEVALISGRVEEDPAGGIALVPQVRALCPKLQIIVLLDDDDRQFVIQLFRAGAQGVFCRTDSYRMIAKAIICVHAGQIWASNKHLKMVISALSEPTPVHPVSVNGQRLLSMREEQIVSLVVTGLTNREVAAQLRLSDHTVKNYLFQIYEKLGVSNRVELTLYCQRPGEGLAPPEEAPERQRQHSISSLTSWGLYNRRPPAIVASMPDVDKHGKFINGS